MASVAPSDTESNVSGFVRCSDKNYQHLYTSMIQSMEMVNQDLLQIESNLTNIVKQAGPLESQMAAVLQSLPTPAIHMMDTE